MNPFDLRGPQFLAFYAALMFATALVLSIARRAFESGPVPRLPHVDPYLIAYLRGGPHEAVRVATFALLDRGLLVTKDDRLEVKPRAEAQVRRPIERAILAAVNTSGHAYLLLKHHAVLASTASLEAELVELQLVPGPAERVRRRLLGLGAVALLWSVAAIKIAVALARGKHNLAFLILLALASLVLVVLVLKQSRTTRGDRLLADLRTLFGGLRARTFTLRSGAASQELALLTGVFGFSALSGEPLELSRKLFPGVARSDKGGSCSSSWGSSSCGSSSSCSSSSSSSCSGGSSCGGGGGGGCGGCGS